MKFSPDLHYTHRRLQCVTGDNFDDLRTREAYILRMNSLLLKYRIW